MYGLKTKGLNIAKDICFSKLLCQLQQTPCLQDLKWFLCIVSLLLTDKPFLLYEPLIILHNKGTSCRSRSHCTAHTTYGLILNLHCLIRHSFCLKNSKIAKCLFSPKVSINFHSTLYQTTKS